MLLKKTTGEDFVTFQKEFKKWQKFFGLNGYTIYFKYKPLDDQFADIEIEQNIMAAIVRLNSRLSENSEPFKDIKRSAKHEAIHLLIGRLNYLATCRYVESKDIYEASEELVHRLDGLIPD